MPKPFPIPAPRIPYHEYERAAVERKLECRQYSECLRIAMRFRDKDGEPMGFACTACKVDDPMSRDELRRDIEAIANMLFAVVGRNMEPGRSMIDWTEE